MAWPFTSDEEDPYTVPGLGGLLPPMPQSQIIPTSNYRGLLGSAPNQDVALAIASLGAGLAGGRGRTRGEAWGSGLQQGMTGLLGTATLSGRQKALEQEVALREQDRKMRAEQIAFAQAEQQRKQAAVAELIKKYPHLAAEINAGLGADLFKPQKIGPGDVVGIPATGQTLLQGGPKITEASPIAKLVQERDALPPESPLRQTYDDAIKKATTHQPAAMAIAMGSPVPIAGPGGETQYMQPANGPGAPPQVMVDPRTGLPAVRPPPEKQPPAGYRFGANEQLEAIPGGPATKLGETERTQITGVNNLRSAISEYRSELNKFSTTDVMSPSARAAMGTKYNNMLLQGKEAYRLGVLNGPDYKILQSVITDPTTIKGFITPKAALDKQAAELDRIMGVIAGNVAGRPGQPDGKRLRFDAQGNPLP